MDTYYNLLEYKLCNETSMKYLGDEFLLDISIENLYCIDMEDLDMGGAWNSEYINYIRFDLYLCQNGINYNESDSNCTSYDKLKEAIGNNNNWYFELLYPVVQFQPSIHKTPILILYKTYFYGLSIKTSKLDRLYLQEHIIEDEEGWIFSKPINKSYWGLSSLKGDNYIIEEVDNLKYGNNSRLYSLKIYLDLNTVYYTRTYKKLIEILGEAFPILKAFSAIFCFISEIINEILATRKLNEYIVYSDKKKDIFNKEQNKTINVKKFIKKYNKSLNGSSINGFTFINNIDDSSKIHNLSNKDKMKHKINMRISNKSCCFQNNINTIHSNNENLNRTNTNPFEFLKKEKYPLRFYFYGLCPYDSRKTFGLVFR